jgi:hypothetical protein
MPAKGQAGNIGRKKFADTDLNLWNYYFYVNKFFWFLPVIDYEINGY